MHRPKDCTEALGAITFAENPVLPVEALADVHLVCRNLLHPVLHDILQGIILGLTNDDTAETACVSDIPATSDKERQQGAAEQQENHKV